MPAELESCVQKVMAQGHDESSAYAICKASMDSAAKFPGMTIDRMSVSTRKVTDEGYLLLDALLARTGIQEYYAFEMGTPPGFEPMDIIRVWRSEDEVFSPESMDSFAMKPVTNDHPPVMLDVSNVKTYQIGHVGETVSREGDHLKAKILISDQKGIDLLKSGKVELSNGYFSDYVFEKGTTPDGQQYDAKQVKIRGNHVALVDKGRCGGSCKVQDTEPVKTKDCQCGGNPMPKEVIVKIAGVDVKVSDEATATALLEAINADKLQKVKDENAELVAKQKELEDEKEKMKGENDSLQAQLDAAKAATLDAAGIDKLVEARTAFIDQLVKINPKIEWKGKTRDALIQETVTAAYPQESFDGKSNEYMEARFDVMVNTKDQATEDLKKALQMGTRSKDTKPVEQARQEFMDRSKTAYLKPNEAV